MGFVYTLNHSGWYGKYTQSAMPWHEGIYHTGLPRVEPQCNMELP